MKLTCRNYHDEDDYWRIRDFLRTVFLLNERREFSWQAYRFDYWRWHGVANLGQGPLQEFVFLWETADGQIAAVLNREGMGHAHLQCHPQLCPPELEEEMIAVAEERLTRQSDERRRRLVIWTNEHNRARQRFLTSRGYTKADQVEYQRRRPLSRPIPEAPVAPGYSVRSLGDETELPARSWVSWRAFHPDEPDDRYEGWTWYPNVQRAPLYRRDLDIVAIAPGGEFVAFCTVWFDDVTRSAAFEPVGADPAHQRRGLGKAIMCEGLRRVKRLGAIMAYVGSYSASAHALYASAGFTDYDLCFPWVKEWEAELGGDLS